MPLTGDEVDVVEGVQHVDAEFGGRAAPRRHSLRDPDVELLEQKSTLPLRPPCPPWWRVVIPTRVLRRCADSSGWLSRRLLPDGGEQRRALNLDEARPGCSRFLRVTIEHAQVVRA